MQLIKDIFLPERMGTNYLFAKYVVSVSFGKTSLIATKAYLKGTNVTIEKIIEEKIDLTSVEEHESDRTVKALKNLFTKIGSYDEVRAIIPSSLVVFKELSLPFFERDKINMVIGFEIEPLLPFALRDAVIDFVIIKQSPEAKSSDILVTAIQKQYIVEYLTLFSTANINLDVITVDTVSLYGLYSTIPSYNQLQGGTALIDIGLHTTRITLMINSHLKMIRTLPKGIIAITKKAAQDLHVTPNEVMEKLIRFGLEQTEPSEYTATIQAAAQSLWDDIQFTFTSFTTQFLNRSPMTRAIILGDGALIKGCLSSLANRINVPCEEFPLHALAEIKTVKIKNEAVINPINIVSVSGAINSPLTLDYTLEHDEFVKPNYMLLAQQLIIMIVLTVGLFATITSHYSVQRSKLTKEHQASQQQVITTLKNAFKNIEKKSLSDVIDEAEDEVKKQKETWFAFSNQSRVSFLQYLLEFSTLIDVRSIGLDLEQIILSEKEMLVKARVRDWGALQTFERELEQSKSFKNFERQETLQFTMRIVLAPITEEM